jgi:hypothetical protein
MSDANRDGARGDNFGGAVGAATDGMLMASMLMAGAPLDDDDGIASGSVYVFEKSSSGQYEQASKRLVASDRSTYFE